MAGNGLPLYNGV